MVILMNDADQYILSTRNQFCGTVKSVTPGASTAKWWWTWVLTAK